MNTIERSSSKKFFPENTEILDEHTILLSKFFIVLFDDYKDDEEFRNISLQFNDTLKLEDIKKRTKLLQSASDRLFKFIRVKNINQLDLFLKITAFDSKDIINNFEFVKLTPEEMKQHEEDLKQMKERELKEKNNIKNESIITTSTTTTVEDTNIITTSTTTTTNKSRLDELYV